MSETVSALLLPGKKPLSDAQQLLILFYLSTDRLEVTENVAARFFNWSRIRARQALAQCQQNGWIKGGAK